jgi:alanine racemase
MVRPGILLYGYNTVSGATSTGDFQVQPVMELRTTVVFVKRIKKGESISYGRTWTAPQDTFIAVLNAGYADGLPVLASGKWQVLINEKTYPLVARICMDQCFVDIGPAGESLPDVRVGDEAVLFGTPPFDAAALARKIGTIPYEITCNVNKRVFRVYL